MCRNRSDKVEMLIVLEVGDGYMGFHYEHAETHTHTHTQL